jgi:hypothetical protein
MTTYTKKSLLAITTLAASCSAFLQDPALVRRPAVMMVPRYALIYGWDGQLESDTTLSSSSSSSSPSYMDVTSDLYQTCSPVGSAVAQALSYDQDRAGHLARLAVAFSPPERALRLDAIEQVEVVCVHDDSIELQAVICQEGGCVSLNVPVTFPRSCYAEDPSSLEGCIMKNLQELDAHAVTVLQNKQQDDDTCQLLNDQFHNFPEWWIPPECDPTLTADCEIVKGLLNDAEFQEDVRALAQDAVNRIEDDWRVLQAKVAIVGPAGLCFKVKATQQQQHGSSASVAQVLDVVHPFDQVMSTVDALRAAVLGAIASAEGK